MQSLERLLFICSQAHHSRMDQFEYVMYGRVYRIEGEDGGEGSRLGVYVSYGGMFLYHWGLEYYVCFVLEFRSLLYPYFSFSSQVFWCDWREMLSICRDSIKMRMCIFLWRRSNSKSNLLYLTHLWTLYFFSFPSFSFHFFLDPFNFSIWLTLSFLISESLLNDCYLLSTTILHE